MDDAVMERFLEIFDEQQSWSVSRRHARRTGVMIFLHPRKDRDWVTGVKWDPELFIRQKDGFDGYSPMAWRRDFVEKVTSLGYVPNLDEMPSVEDISLRNL